MHLPILSEIVIGNNVGKELSIVNKEEIDVFLEL